MSRTVISVPIEKYTFSELDDDTARVRINVFHNSYNPNGSCFEDESLENSQESFKNKPICCAYKYDDEGNIDDFKEHDEEESPVGTIPETNNYSIEEIDDLKWACVDGIIFKEYCPEAYQLLKEGKKISMEIDVLEGFKGKDNFYHIKKFNLLCITILSNMYSPAMGSNATIELLSNTDSESFATKFSAIINKANVIVDNMSTEGGKKVKREEIILKFSTLNEKVEGYKSIIDNSELSEEELEKQLFSLSQNQLRQFIAEALSTEKIIKQYWDGESYETSKYYLEDIIAVDNIAIVCNKEDYKDYGVSYSMSGDKVTLNFANAKRYVVGDWRPFEDGQSEPLNSTAVFVEEIIEQAKTEIGNTKDSFNAKETEEYKTMEADLNTKVKEFKVIEADLTKVKADYTTLQSDKVSLDEEIKDLRQFKADKEQEFKEVQVNEVLSKFTELETIDGYKELVEDKFNYTLEELETKLKVFAFDNNIVIGKKQKFTTKTEKPVNLPLEGKVSNGGYTGAWNVLDNYIKFQ